MKQKILALILAAVLVVGLLPLNAFAAQQEESVLSQQLTALKENEPQKAEIAAVSATGLTGKPVASVGTELKQSADVSANPAVTTYAPTDSVRVLVVLKSPALLEQGYAKSELGSAPAKRAARSLEATQNAVAAKIETAVAEMDATAQVELNYHYTTLLNGISVEMPYGALPEVRALNEVATALVVPTYSLPEDMSGQTASPAMVATKETFGSTQTWEAGYTGAGMRTAIIDTGLDLDHPSFAAAPAEPSLTEAEIETVLTSLNAYERYSQKNSVKLRASNLYYTEKVAYGFNYVDNDLDITHDRDNQGDHGTHVAGITAANKTEGTDVVGVAPDAQLLIMKVFGKNGGAYFDDIVAALEDCFYLNVDAVNMSLGSPAGFATSSEGDELDLLSDYIFSQVEEHDMIAAIAAGNSYSASYGTPLGTDLDYASNPDNSIISSPATYPSATAVASVENAYMLNYYIQVGENKLPYTDVATMSFLTMQGTWDYVMIPGVGESADFDGLDLYGKIAVIQRGSIAFTDKQTNALYAGASAVIVYDNVEDDLLNMEDAGYLPNIFVSKASGAVLAAAADENGIGTLTITDDMMEVVSSTSGLMSDFSSWGVGTDLTLLPDVTAPGGNIYSTINDGKYGVMSGTSMATPHITGLSALVLEYLHEKYPDQTESWYRTVAEALIMSTAEPVDEPSGLPYSPRKQGAGAANAYSAVSSAAYLTVNGSSPKVSFGDDAQKTGLYTFSFELNNLTDKPQTYNLEGEALTDQVQIIDGVKYMGESSRALSGSFSFHVRDNDITPYDYNADGSFNRDDVQAFLDDVNGAGAKAGFDLNGDGKTDTADVQLLYTELTTPDAGTRTESVTLPAGGSVTVTVQLALSESDKAYMDVNYENGIYVDGFVRCYAENDGTDLSLPFLGFYGEWSAAPIFDDDAWLSNDYPNPSRYWNVLWTTEGYWTLGDNAYTTESHDDSHNVLSPNGDGYQDAVSNIYLGLLRNAKKLTFTWKDEAGNVLLQTQADYARKSYYNASYGICYPFLYDPGDGSSEYFTFLDENGNCAYEDLTRFTLTIDGWLDDGDDVCDDTYTVPMILDTTAPELDLNSLCFVSNGAEGVERQIGFTVSDNYDIAAVVTLTTAGSVIETIPVNTRKDGETGESQFITLDVTKYDSDFFVAVCDYGYNESYYQISFTGENNVNPDAFYGYRNVSIISMDGYYYVTTGYNGWHSFTDPTSLLMHTSALDTGEVSVNAAEYVDGYVIGVDANGDIFTMKNGQWNRNIIGSAADYPQVLDMAYDFSSNTMYVLTDEADYGMGGHLLTMNILTGELTDLGAVTGFEGYNAQPLTLACDNDGILYTVDHASGDLYTIDPESLAGTLVGPTGYVPQYGQSMTVDHTTNELYWASYAGAYSLVGSGFFQIDKKTGEILSKEELEYGSEITGLYKPYLGCDDVIPAPESTTLTGITLSAQSISLATGTQAAVSASPVPYYAELGELSWSSGDEAVATVENGVITAVGAGKTTITATAANGAKAECSIEVVSVDADLMVFDAGGDLVWRSFEANNPGGASVMEDAMLPYGNMEYFISAAYAGGTIYAYDTSGGFYRIDAESMEGTRLAINSSLNGSSGSMTAMAYNYADGYLYGIAVSYAGMDSIYQLVRINPSNGDFLTLATFDPNEVGTLVNLAIDPEGGFYSIVSMTDADTWETVYKLMSFKLEDDKVVDMKHSEPMDYSSDSTSFTALVYSYENECLFWTDHYSRVLWVEPGTGRIIVLGTLASSASYPMNVSLIELPEKELAATTATPEKLTVPESIRMLEGSATNISVGVEPWNSAAELSYQIADESVATVDSIGILTAVKEGKTTLTVSEANSGLTATAEVCVVPSAGNLFGNVVYDNGYGSNYWVSLPDNNPEDVSVLGDFSTSGYSLCSGAYYNDCIYAFCHAETDEQEYKYYLLKIDLADGYSYVNLGQVHEIVYDMAFDYTTGTMYGIVTDGGANSKLAQLDLETAAVTTLGDMGDHFVTLAVDGNGQLYGITGTGSLYKVDKANGATTLVGATGVKLADTYQSMHYDYTTGNTYWFQIGTNGTNGLYLVDLATGSATNLGSVFGIGASVAAAYTVSDKAPAVPASVAPTGIDMEAKQTVAVGKSVTLRADVLPRSVAKVDDSFTWTSSDDSIASVDANGTVTGHKAGTVTITATTANGYSATCTFTVTANERRFYAYDETNTQWISFTSDDTLNIQVERVDVEGEDKILASLFHDGKLYSFTEDGRYWSLNPDTFERTLIGNGVMGEKLHSVTMDWWGNVVESDLDLMPLSMGYDEETGKAYVQMAAYEMYEDWWSGEMMKSFVELVLAEIDLSTGAYTIVYHSETSSTNAFVVSGGRFHFVDTFESGMLSVLDLNDENPAREKCALVYNYWGNTDAGRGMLTDSLTGVTYIVRDMTDWGAAPSSLCTINLSDGDIETFGVIGEDGAVVNSLFLH